MAAPANIEERICDEFSSALREYAAFDRTLDALAAFSFVLHGVTEIAQETTLADFRPRLEPAGLDVEPYTPDGLFVQSPNFDFVLELKASWNDKDIGQVIKYAKSSAHLLREGSKRPLGPDRCVLLGYQNPPGETNLGRLFDSWDSHEFGFPLVVFRYSLEQAPGGDRIYFVRVPYDRNGACPPSHFGKAISSPRGFPVSASSFKTHRPKFHRANDQVIASYAAVLWWTQYAKHYLSEEQRSEMAERGRLSSPLVLRLDRVEDVPSPPDVEVPLGAKDVRRALEFLRQTRLVALKKRAKVFEVELKEDRFIRLPRGSPISPPGSQLDVATKILARWATHKVKRPVEEPRQPRSGGRRRAGRDRGSGWLFGETPR